MTFAFQAFGYKIPQGTRAITGHFNKVPFCIVKPTVARIVLTSAVVAEQGRAAIGFVAHLAPCWPRHEQF